MSLPAYWKQEIEALEEYLNEHVFGDGNMELHIDNRYSDEIGYRQRAESAKTPERKAIYLSRAEAAHAEWVELSTKLRDLSDKMTAASIPNLPE